MGYQLHIDPEVESWLTALREHRKADARPVDKAIDRLRNDGAALGPPLAVPVEYAPAAGGDIVPDLDFCYQLQLKALARVRAEVADAASLRATLELHLEEPMTGEQRDRLRAAYDGIRGAGRQGHGGGDRVAARGAGVPRATRDAPGRVLRGPHRRDSAAVQRGPGDRRRRRHPRPAAPHLGTAPTTPPAPSAPASARSS
jgi:hypothetical protein